MMKKLLSGALLIAAIGTVNAQSRASRTHRMNLDPQIFTNLQSPANMQASKTSSILNQSDTLWYFFNKHKFKETVADQPFYVVQASVGTSTNGDLVEFGSAFINTSNAPITVSGALLLISKQTNATSSAIPVRVYLYNASSVGAPTTKIDSVMISVSNTNGTFNSATFATPRTVSGSFFISYRTMPTSQADTLLAWVTSAADPGGSAPINEQYGEGLSYTRAVVTPTPSFDQFFVNTDNLFGAGYDPEAIVVPMVSYSINANYTAATPNATSTPGAYCANQGINFTNTTNPASIVYNRQFNFNKFTTYWAPTTWGFSITPTAADPIDNWSFSNSATTVTTTNASNTLTAAGNFTTTLTIKYRHSPIQPSSQRTSISDVKTSTYTVVDCGLATTGINTVAGFENLNVFPNPTVNGKTTISGLTGSNTIMVYDMLGQVVTSQTTDKETASIDLLNKSNGNYIVKIINSTNNVKVMKIINQN